ncbi:hypothetical protein PISMIDRAFT_658731 [Pisolithus microcarpus 441]|uniref:tryptophan synthase n=1 Tax=Pisolithus microcarpus 441 TaxID=765257 RepID=A0A0C9ZIC7_9AGAM|nr:hypothetical protein PISMIDRAFT_658731 [Pisolithus microcarpus 441]
MVSHSQIPSRTVLSFKKLMPVDYATILRQVREARSKGLTVPVLLMSYYNPRLAYGEDQAVQDAREAGANGFIMVDPHRRGFGVPSARNARTLALSASLHRFPHLTSIANSFPYVVSRMGTTESSVKGFVSSELSDIIARNREHNPRTSRRGFLGCNASSLRHRRRWQSHSLPRARQIMFASGREGPKGSSSSDSSTAGVQSSQYHYSVVAGISRPTRMTLLPPRFGQFNSEYIPKAPYDCFIELEEAHKAIWNDLTF